MPHARNNTPTLGLFSGYASVFHKPDAAGDVIVPGAFTASLRRRKPADVRLLCQHNPAQPAGVWLHLEEDGYGLWAKGALLLDSFCGRESFAQLRGRALDGLSIGFHVRKSHACRKTGRRMLHAIDLIEISLVTFPMHPQARVHDVAPDGGQPCDLPHLFYKAARHLVPPHPHP